MKILILAGFLGSGKTTVLLQLAKYLVKTSPAGQSSVVILENEIGQNGVDNKLLSAAGFNVSSIFSGCICCSSTGMLVADVQKIRKEFDPQWLVIEATGLAYPDQIRDTLRQELDMDASVLTIAEAQRWKRIMIAMGQFVVSQMKGASVVLITKIDKVAPEIVEQVRTGVLEIVGDAPIYPICAIDPLPDSFWEEVLEKMAV